MVMESRMRWKGKAMLMQMVLLIFSIKIAMVLLIPSPVSESACYIIPCTCIAHTIINTRMQVLGVFAFMHS
jgi:hypothetical protein